MRQNVAVTSGAHTKDILRQHKGNKKSDFYAYPNQLAPPGVHPVHIAGRLQEHSSQSEKHPHPSLMTLHQIQTFAVCKKKKKKYNSEIELNDNHSTEIEILS